MDIEGIIFDFDGTLVDSMFIWQTIGSDYLLSKNIKPKKNLYNSLKSLSLEEAAEYYQKNYNIKDNKSKINIESTNVPSKSKILKDINIILKNYYLNKVCLKEGVKEFLNFLFINKIEMCIATATDKEMVEIVLSKYRLNKYFKKVLTCNEVGEGKNSSLIFDKAISSLELKKEQVYIFEDSLHAIETAKKNGFKIVGVEDFYSKEDKEQIVMLSDRYLDSFTNWREIFD
jgi:beta-phosphoglucomutase-like phosphatase (HAD superfamily)